MEFWLLLDFMTPTLGDEHPYLLHKILFFIVDVYIIFITYLNLIRLIVVPFFGIFDRVLSVWNPSTDTHTPLTWRILHRSPSITHMTTVGTTA